MTPGNDLGKSGRGPGIRNPPARITNSRHVPVAKIPLFDRIRSRCALARTFYIFVFVIFILAMPLFL